jgi:hypothetical protein
LGQKQASNIPIKKGKAYLQKPAILATSKRTLPTLFIKSWSFWVFVQILGFHCPPMRNQLGRNEERT